MGEVSKVLCEPNGVENQNSRYSITAQSLAQESSPSDGDNDIAYEPPPESQPTPSASSSDQIKVVIDSGTVKPQHVQSSSKASNKVSDQNSKESTPLLPIFSSNQPSTVSYTPSKPSASSSGTVKPQHVQSSSKGTDKVSDQNSKESSPLLNTISSNQPTVSYTPSKPSASSSNLPQSSGVSSSRTVKPQHVQSSIQTKTNEVSHSSKTSIPLPPTFSSRPLQSPSKPSGSSSNLHQSQSPSNLPPSSSSPSSSLASPPYSSKPPPSTSDPPLPFTKQPPAFKPILSDQERIVPPVLKQPLSPSTYKAYFAALLYAEDYYLELKSLSAHLPLTTHIRRAATPEMTAKLKGKENKGGGRRRDRGLLLEGWGFFRYSGGLS
uniref:Uncharacterized protein n=1 Tax=Fagus sylvatica TaxID=28930 RepID=A0A2N9J151_FAGSY